MLSFQLWVKASRYELDKGKNLTEDSTTAIMIANSKGWERD